MITLAVSTLFSCKKSDEAQPVSATLTISQPVLNQAYKTGDTVTIKCTAENPTALHGCHVFILNSANDTLFHEHDHTHAATLNIEKRWVNTLTTPQQLKVLVACVVAHDGQEVKKEVMIRTIQ